MLNWLTVIVCCLTLLISCGENSNIAETIDSSLHMRPPVPVIVQSPSSTDELKFPRGTCVIVVRDQDWLFAIDNDTTVCKTSQEFRTFINSNGGSTLNGKIALQTDSKASDRLDTTIVLLKLDSIMRFNLITDLDERTR